MTTLMTDGKEVDFGKKTAVFNVTDDSNGLTLTAATVDGNYSSHTIGSVEELHAYAAYGLRAFARSQNLSSAEGFNDVNWSDPTARKPRASAGPKATPLEAALAEVTGKEVSVLRPWLESKSRKERNALANDPRVITVLARYKAEAEEAKRARKAAKAGDDAPAPVDLLADIA